MFSKLNLHLFRRKKIENRLKNDRFIQFFGFNCYLGVIQWLNSVKPGSLLREAIGGDWLSAGLASFSPVHGHRGISADSSSAV